MKISTLICSLVLALTFSLSAFAKVAQVSQISADKSLEIASTIFRVTNESGLTICKLYFSPDYSEEWGPDLLGDKTLPDDSYADIRINIDHCDFDIKVVACSGEKAEAAVDVCEQTGIVFH